jgi:hypothetical protein
MGFGMVFISVLADVMHYAGKSNTPWGIVEINQQCHRYEQVNQHV